MDVALLAIRALLAAVFAVAAFGKLADLAGSRRAVAAFGVPSALAPAVGTALPLVELAIAVFLLPSATAVWAAIAAALLLGAFSIAIGWSIATGRAPDCHCFGQLHSEPAGWPTLLRNLVLCAGAVFVAAAGWNDPGTSGVAWIGDLHGAGIAAAVAVVVAVLSALASLYLLAANRRLALRVDRLELGEPMHGRPLRAPAPDFALRDLDGKKRTLADVLTPGRPTLLVFVDPACGPCEAILSAVARLQRERQGELTVAAISSGSDEDVRAKTSKHGLGLVLLDRRRKVYRAYDADGTPSAVLLTGDGLVDSATVGGARDIHALLEERLGIVTPGGLPLGEEIPNLVLHDLDHGHVELASFRGRELLILFWSSAARDARELHADLRAWELEGQSEPVLAVVSRDAPETLREEGFESAVLLDEAGEAAFAFSCFEPPAAVLVDAEGRVAWPLAVGSDHILRLLRSSSAAARAPSR
jgi:peroxiredoxin/uncharacterized membrane protein YphA (DoxX/SURF4 family)